MRDHPALFEEYALTDAVIPALWVVKTYGLLLDRLGIKKKVVTLGGAAVELVKEQAKSQGNRAARISRTREKEEAAAGSTWCRKIAIAAQSYHGGYNIATALGFSPEGRELHDLDIRSAYTTALAFIGSSRLAQRATMRRAGPAGGDRRGDDGGAGRDSGFPTERGFHACRSGPRTAEGWFTRWRERPGAPGPNWWSPSTAARAIRVKEGYRIDWISGRGPTVRGHHAADRRDQGRGQGDAIRPTWCSTRLVKEIGNSIYGKVAQAVAGTRIIKDDIEQRHVFNTKFGVTDQMGPSAITNAMMAAYCTGLVSALLTETMIAAAGRDVGRDGDHGRHADPPAGSMDIDQSGPVAMRVQGGARAHHAGRQHDLGGEAYDPRGRW